MRQESLCCTQTMQLSENARTSGGRRYHEQACALFSRACTVQRVAESDRGLGICTAPYPGHVAWRRTHCMTTGLVQEATDRILKGDAKPRVSREDPRVATLVRHYAVRAPTHHRPCHSHQR